MNTALSLANWIQEELPFMAAIEKRILDAIKGQSQVMTQFALHTTNSGGKRLRPMLVALTATCFEPEPEVLIDVAAAAELIHTASLVHDDVIDGAKERRGHPSLNTLWGDREAVLTGDFLFATAFRLLTRHQKLGVLGFMTDAIREMCEGEIEQAHSAFDCGRSEADYLRQIRRKTASLIAACCQAGAAIGGASEEHIANSLDFGLNIGYAFQITDDVLDLAESPESTGKPQGQDLRQGVITLPIIYLLSGRNGARVRRIIENRTLGEKDIAFIGRLALESGAIAAAYDAAESFLNKAKASLAQLPVSQESAPAQLLRTLTESILHRRA